MLEFDIDKAYLVGTWLAGVLWGVFTVVFIACMVSTSTSRSRYKESGTFTGFFKWNILLVIALYGLATTHCALVLARTMEAFTTHAQDGSTKSYLADLNNPLGHGVVVLYVITFVMGDFVLLWRCYAVWGGNLYVIAFPAMMLAGSTIAGFVADSFYFKSSASVVLQVHWGIATFSMSIAINIFVTLLTAGRIWYLARGLAGLPSQTIYRRIIILIIESGFIVTICKIIEFVLYRTADGDADGNWALFVLISFMPQIMGICPTFIVMAVNSGFTNSLSTEVYSSSERASAIRFNVSVPFVAERPTRTIGPTDSTFDGIAQQGKTVP